MNLEYIKKTTAMFLICVMIILGMSFNIWFVLNSGSYQILEFCIIFMLIYMLFVFVVMSRFEYTLKKTFVNTVMLIMNNFFQFNYDNFSSDWRVVYVFVKCLH